MLKILCVPAAVPQVANSLHNYRHSVTGVKMSGNAKIEVEAEAVCTKAA